MKKFLLIPIAFFLMCCEVKVDTRTVSAGEIYYPSFGNYRRSTISYYDKTIGDVSYRVFYTEHRHDYAGDAMVVVNLTKEKLEVELLKLQIEQLKK